MFRVWAWLAGAGHRGHAFKWLLSASFAWHRQGWAVCLPQAATPIMMSAHTESAPQPQKELSEAMNKGNPFSTMWFLQDIWSQRWENQVAHSRGVLCWTAIGQAQHTETSSSTQPWMPTPCPCFTGILSLPAALSVKAQLKSLRMTGKQSVDLMLQSCLSDREKVFWILNSCNWKLLYSSVWKH